MRMMADLGRSVVGAVVPRESPLCPAVTGTQRALGLFVPKELCWALDLRLVCLSPAATVRRRPRLFAAVRRRCHAVRHSRPSTRPPEGRYETTSQEELRDKTSGPEGCSRGRVPAMADMDSIVITSLAERPSLASRIYEIAETW